MMREVLVIDDERSFGEMLRALLTKEGYTVTYLGRAQAAVDLLATRSFSVVLCDVRMPGMGGMDFLRALRDRQIRATVVMMSAYGTIDTAIDCIKLGAYDYISKPFKAAELTLLLRKIEQRQQSAPPTSDGRPAAAVEVGFDRLVGQSPPMQVLYQTIRRVSDYKSTVLITGESGTGKELVARAIHDQSKRADRPFIAVNCGAIPETLIESELFGHVRGAFTDASRDKKGMFEEANTGTLFLDEIGELPLALQVKLLRAIQEEEIRRVGDSFPRSVDVRIVAATIRNLRDEMAERRFREDLFYRLNVLPIELPPLRERKEDIPLLVDAFVRQSSERLGKRVVGISPEALQILLDYAWPGNVRELENTLERACVFADGDLVTTEVLPEHMHETTDRVRRTLDRGELSIKKTTRLIEEELITRALEQTHGNRTAAARLLEISHRALLYKIKEYGIDIPPGGARG